MQGEKIRKEHRQTVKPTKTLKQPKVQLPASKLGSNTKQDQESKPKSTIRRTSKYANVQSSGYGRPTYNPFQPETKLKRRETKYQTSGGTNATAKSSLPSLEPKPTRVRRSTNLPAVERNRQKEQKSYNLPPIKV